MSRMGWIILLVAVGIGLAVAIGFAGSKNSSGSGSSSSATKAQATSALCSSVKSLVGSVQNLTGLSSSSSKSDWDTDVTAVQTAWDQVTADAKAVQSASTGDLDTAWNAFWSAVKAVPSSASVSDAVSSVTQSANQLVSAAQTTASQLTCS